MSTRDNSKRIAKNTLFLYFRMLFTMGISFYTSRVVLIALGVEDYGIYNVVGGIVIVFSFLNIAMTSASQRFISFEIGKNNKEQLQKIFSTAVIIHVFIGLIIIVLAETIGLWFLNTKINIHAERIHAANLVYQFSILSSFVTIINVPYNACIIAHENMKSFAYIGILDTILKLISAISIVWIRSDRLIVYAFLICLISIIITVIYIFYCKIRFQECKCRFVIDKPVFNSMLIYLGWDLIGSCSQVAKNQGINILLNIFFGTVVNAANGIAFQVQSAISRFSGSFLMAVSPQITKNFAAKNIEESEKLVLQGSRIAIYLLIFLSLPVLIEAEYILKLWLKIVPESTEIFVRLILLFSLVSILKNMPLVLLQATGKIRNFQIYGGGILLLNIPVSYLFLHDGFPAYTVFIVGIIIEFAALMILLYHVRCLTGFLISNYLKYTVFYSAIIGMVAVFPPYMYYHYNAPSLFRLSMVCCISFLSTIISIYYIGLNANEKRIITNKIRTYKKYFIK